MIHLVYARFPYHIYSATIRLSLVNNHISFGTYGSLCLLCMHTRQKYFLICPLRCQFRIELNKFFMFFLGISLLCLLFWGVNYLRSKFMNHTEEQTLRFSCKIWLLCLPCILPIVAVSIWNSYSIDLNQRSVRWQLNPYVHRIYHSTLASVYLLVWTPQFIIVFQI